MIVRPVTSASVRELFVLVYAVALLMTCVYNFAVSPLTFCLMEGDCAGVTITTVQGTYSRTMAASCFLSLVSLLRKYCAAMPAYEKNVKACEAYSATTAAERRNRAALNVAYVAVCLAVTVPINTVRLAMTYGQYRDLFLLVFFVFLYSENIGMCMVETHFVKLCRALGRMFRHVNGDLELLAEEIADTSATAADSTPRVHRRPGDAGNCAIYCGDFGGPGFERSLANAVEVLRIRHRLIRDAAHVLDDMYGVSMGSSLFNLGIMALFDIYYEVFNFAGVNTRLVIFIYMWLIQYSLRFYMIVMTAHNTSKQALQSKILITDINNRSLDSNTREELTLFLNQVSSCTIEFTACDFFTLNTHLITSSIGAGVTFLVILLQFNSPEE